MTNARADGLGVLALVPEDWAVAWQRRHQVLSRLSTQVPVAWISPPLHWRERLRTRRAGDAVYPAPHPRMFMLASTDGVPAVNVPLALRRAILRHRAFRGADWLHNQGCRSIELQMWLPEFADALDWGLHTSSSYHIDDEYSWSTVDRPMSAAERRLITRVNRVFVSSRKLLETKAGINPHTIFSSNGVDFDAFSTLVAEPDDLAGIPHPRVGYVGVLKEQLDWGLLETLAIRHPTWSFVFVGPVRSAHVALRPILARLEQFPNVRFLGERRATELPAYLQHLDVSLLPYKRNDYTDAINPMKLYESLAAGIPIVATPIRTVLPFAPMVTLAGTEVAWESGIATALALESRTVARRMERQAAAREYDWSSIAIGLLPPTSER